MTREHEVTCRAPDQAVGVARRAAPEPGLHRMNLVAPITLVAHDKSQPSAEVACVGLRAREPFNHPLQLAALVQPPYVVGAADVNAADEHARQSSGRAPAAAEDRLELVSEPVVDGDVALVDGDAESAEDGADGAAVIEGAADDAEAGVVDDDGAGVGVRRRRKGVALGGG